MKNNKVLKMLLQVFFCFSTLSCFSQSVQFDPVLNDTFFTKDLYEYPWWIVVDDSGRVASIFEDKPNLKNKQNRKKRVTSQCIETYISTESSNSYTRYSIYSKAYLVNDTLCIDFEFSPAPHYEIWKARIRDTSIQTSWETHPSERPISDSMEKAMTEDPNYAHPFIREKIILNKRKHKKGDILLGKVYFTIPNRYTAGGKEYYYEYKYEGLIKCKVK